MINEASLNQAQFLQLDTNIRTSSTSTFNAQEAFENVFEDVVQEHIAAEQVQKENKINFYNLGLPAGMELDTSLYDERMAQEGSFQANFQNVSLNPYSLL